MPFVLSIGPTVPVAFPRPAWRSTASRTLTASLPLIDSKIWPLRRYTTNGTVETLYSSEILGSSSALILTNEMVGGVVAGYCEARAESTAPICAHGAAYGVWKYRTTNTEGDRGERCDKKSALDMISVSVDMVECV